MIKYNLDIYKNNKEDFVAKTVPHEIAHLFTYREYILPRCRCDVKPHGKEWRLVMTLMGLNPKRCHSYEVKKARKVMKPYIYRCTCMDHHLTRLMHNKILKGINIRCLKCHHRVMFHRMDATLVSPIIDLNREELIKRIAESKKQLELLGM